MQRLLVLGVAALVAAAMSIAPTLAQGRAAPRITVTGEANVSAPPDLAHFSTGVTTAAKTAREASDGNNKAVAAVIAALKAAGIADKDIQTTRLTLQPVYAPARSGDPTKIVGFQASNQVTIKVRDVSALADLIDRVVAAGATDISGIEFEIAEPAPLLDKARADAVVDARRKAEIYAKAAGVTLGRVISVSESQAASGPIMARAAVGGIATPIEPGEQTLHLAVTVNFEIAQ